MVNRRQIEISQASIVSAVNRARRDHGRCRVDDVAEELGLNRSTVHRRMQELVEDEVLEVLGETGRGGYRVVGEKIKG